MELKWIKICSDIFNDEKIMLIEQMPDAYAIITCWFKLLCLAGRTNNGGVFFLADKVPYTDEMFSAVFRMPVNTVRAALNTFESFDMIETVDGVVTIPNWEKHQSAEGIERIRQQTQARVANYRERQKQLVSEVNSNVTSNVTVTHGNATDKNKNKNKNKNKSKNSVICPSLEDVKAYVAERKSNVDPVKFFEYYEAGGWKDGKGQPVKNWKQKLITWERHEIKSKNAPISGDPVKADDVKRFLNGL